MLEYPELKIISNQMRGVLIGKTVIQGMLGKQNANLFMGQEDHLKYALLQDGKVTHIDFSAPEIYIALNNGYGILICQCGGKINYHQNRNDVPENYTIRFDFQDGSSLAYTMKLWSLGIYAISCDEWTARKQKKELRQYQPQAGDFDHYIGFLHQNEDQAKLPIKIFLSKFVAGIMSTYAAETLFYAKINPSTQLGKLSLTEQKQIYESLNHIVATSFMKGGKTSETDLFGHTGEYQPVTERKNIGKGCPICATPLTKNSTGGATAFCPVCQSRQ